MGEQRAQWRVVAGMYPPKNVADYAAYARAVVHRYKDRVHYWEIWNEENSSAFWKGGVSAAKYAALLKATYAAIKAEDPTATVLLGGTVGFDKSFMDGIVAAGAWSSFDALAIHTYVAGQPETSMIVPWLDNARAYVDSKGSKPDLGHRVRLVDLPGIRLGLYRRDRDPPGRVHRADLPPCGRGRRAGHVPVQPAGIRHERDIAPRQLWDRPG